jgi:hypothetical protein
MKTLYATVGAFALLFTAACDQGEPVLSETTTTPATETADTSVPAAATRRMYVLASGEMEASDLLGASVHDMADAEISVVEDIWLSGDNADAMLILRDGGVAGVGGDLRLAAFDAATIVPDASKAGDEPNVIVRLTRDSMGTLPEFKQATADDFRLASELMGKTVTINPGGGSVRIHDLILAADGKTNFAVISPDLISLEQIVVDGDAIVLAQGDADGEVVLDLTAAALAEAPGYKRE